MVGGMCGRGKCVAGVCMGHAWQGGGVAGVACMAEGDMHGRGGMHGGGHV